MSYNNGVFSLFAQNGVITNLYADQKIPSFKPPTGFFYSSVYGKSIAPTLSTSLAGNVSSFYAQNINATISSSTTLSIAYGLNIAGPLVQAGTVSYAYSLFVLPPSSTGSGNIVNAVGAYFALPTVGTNSAGVGIGTATPMNTLDVAGGMAVGAYAGSITVNASILAIAGAQTTTQAVGIKTGSPRYYLDVQGTLNAGAAYGWMPLGQQQRTTLAEGYSQGGGFGGGNVGSYQVISARNTSFFDITTVKTVIFGYAGAVFDGRYLYYVPRFGSTGFIGQILRYDTTLPFSLSASYSYFDTSQGVNGGAVGMYGAAFDGTNIYFPCRYNTFSGANTLLVRYNTTLPFSSSASYQIMDASTIQSGAQGYQNPLFDGRYMYFVTQASAYLLRYDTTLSFTAATSYQVFNQNSLNSFGYFTGSGTFDGRYVYFAPEGGATTTGFLARYDTTLPFSISSSYVTFSLFSIPNNGTYHYASACFDGRFLYYSPHALYASGASFQVAFSGAALRYDTTLSFTAPLSYSTFDFAQLNTNAVGVIGSAFDGRYVWFMGTDQFPLSWGLPVLYDTTEPWGVSTSYSFFDLTTINANAKAFAGLCFDGNYVYAVPATGSIISRMQAYSGYPSSAMSNALYVNNGFLLGTGLTNMVTSQTANGGSFSIPSSPAGYIKFMMGRGNIRTIPYY